MHRRRIGRCKIVAVVDSFAARSLLNHFISRMLSVWRSSCRQPSRIHSNVMMSKIEVTWECGSLHLLFRTVVFLMRLGLWTVLESLHLWLSVRLSLTRKFVSAILIRTASGMTLLIDALPLQSQEGLFVRVHVARVRMQ